MTLGRVVNLVKLFWRCSNKLECLSMVFFSCESNICEKDSYSGWLPKSQMLVDQPENFY
jgi:hypothetical protein